MRVTDVTNIGMVINKLITQYMYKVMHIMKEPHITYLYT